MTETSPRGMVGMVPDLTTLTPQEHEALCRRCGMSCHFAIPVNGLAVVIDALRCKFLVRDDEGKFACSVYDRRFELAPWCHTAQSALSGGFLAQDCPYARGVTGYRGKVRLSPALLRKVLPAVRAEVARAGAPIGADPDAVAAFLGEAEAAPWQYAVSADGSRYVFTPADEGMNPQSAAELAQSYQTVVSETSAENTQVVTNDQRNETPFGGRRSPKLRVL